MSRLSSAPLLLFILGLGSVDSVHAQFVPVLSGFELPELDGSPVDTCRMVVLPASNSNPSVPIATADPTVSITTATTTATSTADRATPTKPVIQSQPTPRDDRPIRRPGFVHHIWAKIQQPMKTQQGQSSSESTEFDLTSVKTTMRTNRNLWRVLSLSSEDSSEEE